MSTQPIKPTASGLHPAALNRVLVAPTQVRITRASIRVADPQTATKRAAREVKPRAMPKYHLTVREHEIIDAMIDESASNLDLAKKFGISEETVKRHLSNIFDKLGVDNRLGLVVKVLHENTERLPVVAELKQKNAELEAALAQERQIWGAELEAKDQQLAALTTQLNFASRCLETSGLRHKEGNA